jgi:hypothetical protein
MFGFHEFDSPEYLCGDFRAKFVHCLVCRRLAALDAARLIAMYLLCDPGPIFQLW